VLHYSEREHRKADISRLCCMSMARGMAAGKLLLPSVFSPSQSSAAAAGLPTCARAAHQDNDGDKSEGSKQLLAAYLISAGKSISRAKRMAATTRTITAAISPHSTPAAPLHHLSTMRGTLLWHGIWHIKQRSLTRCLTRHARSMLATPLSLALLIANKAA